MDGDGNEDVFLSQNFFATNPDNETTQAGIMAEGDGSRIESSKRSRKWDQGVENKEAARSPTTMEMGVWT